MPEPNHIKFEGPMGRTVVFLLPCKSGQTSVKLALWHLRWGKPYDGENIHDQALFTYVEKTTPADYVVGLIRHPLERSISQYAYNRQNPHPTYLNWIRRLAHTSDNEMDQHERSQAWDLMDGGVVLPTHMLYLEHLKEDWEGLCFLLWDKVGADEGVPPIVRCNTLEDNRIRRPVILALNDKDSEESQHLSARYAADYALWGLLQGKRGG